MPLKNYGIIIYGICITRELQLNNKHDTSHISQAVARTRPDELHVECKLVCTRHRFQLFQVSILIGYLLLFSLLIFMN
jgi:hypothetical protein